MNGVDRGASCDSVLPINVKYPPMLESLMILYNYIISLEYVYCGFIGIVIYMVVNGSIISIESNKVD